MTNHQLGEGLLTWHTNEQKTRRFGAVWLYALPESGDPVPVDLDTTARNRIGLLVATVTGLSAARLNQYRPPVLGDQYSLGHGTLFFDTYDGPITAAGVAHPTRNAYWLRPKTLDRLAGHQVRLSLHAADKD